MKGRKLLRYRFKVGKTVTVCIPKRAGDAEADDPDERAKAAAEKELRAEQLYWNDIDDLEVEEIEEDEGETA